jgi:hypothetical protein
MVVMDNLRAKQGRSIRDVHPPSLADASYFSKMIQASF